MGELEKFNFFINKVADYKESVGEITKLEAEYLRQSGNNPNNAAIFRYLENRPKDSVNLEDSVNFRYVPQQSFLDFEKKFPGLLPTFKNLK